MKQTTPTSKMACTSLLTLILFLLVGAYAEASPLWAYCYNQGQNRIYFQSQADIQQHRGSCQGRTYYQGPQNFHLIEDEVDGNGFPRGIEGTSVNMTLNNGRQLLISHWNDLSRSNTLIVLEVDTQNNRVIEHCRVRNHSNQVRARWNGPDNSANGLQLFVRYPLPPNYTEFTARWQTCQLRSNPSAR